MALGSSLVRRVKTLFRRGGLAGKGGAATELRDAVATQGSADAADLARRLAAEEITLADFQSELYLATRRAIVANYALARGGVAALTPADLATIGDLVGAQAGYLRDFTTAIGQGDLTAETIARRAALYPDAGVEAFSRGEAAALGVTLPEHPPKHALCRCHWRFVTTPEGQQVASWQTQQDGRVCPTCQDLASRYGTLAIGAAA